MPSIDMAVRLGPRAAALLSAYLNQVEILSHNARQELYIHGERLSLDHVLDILLRHSRLDLCIQALAGRVARSMDFDRLPPRTLDEVLGGTKSRSVVQKTKRIQMLLDGVTDGAAEATILRTLHTNPVEGGNVLARLASTRGSGTPYIQKLFADLHGDSYYREYRGYPGVLRTLPQCTNGPLLGATLCRELIQYKDREYEWACVRSIVSKARAGHWFHEPGHRGYLADRILAQRNAPDVLKDYIREELQHGSTERARIQTIVEALEGRTGIEAEERILAAFNEETGDHAQVLRGVIERGMLEQLIDDMQGSSFVSLVRILPRCLDGVEVSIAVIEALMKEDPSDVRAQLGVHYAFDRARRDGTLSELLQKLRDRHPARGAKSSEAGLGIRELGKEAEAERIPLVIAHRGSGHDTYAIENTIEGIRRGLELGANAIEIDVCFTKDRHPVLWHDWTHEGIVARIRNLFGEPGSPNRTQLPDLGDSARKPVHQITLAQFQASFGYSVDRAGADTLPPRPPTFEEALREAIEPAGDAVKRIFLDVKVPPDDERLHRSFARRMGEILASSDLPPEKFVFLHVDKQVVRRIKSELAAHGFSYSKDVELVALIQSAENPVTVARKLDNDHASVGYPRVGIGGEAAYFDSLAAARKDIDAAPETPIGLITWTINEERAMRRILGVNVDGIMTDKMRLLWNVVEAYRR